MKKIGLLFISMLILGCVEYKEEWSLDQKGAGTIAITGKIQTQEKNLNSNDFSSFFEPAFLSITQNCAQIGLEIKDIKIDSRKHEFNFIIKFSDIKKIDMNPLFANRKINIEWGQGRKSLKFLHTINPSKNLEKNSWLEEALKEGKFEFEITMPYPIYRASGVVHKGCVAKQSYNLGQINSNTNLTIFLKAKEEPPQNIFILPLYIFGIIILIATAIFIIFLKKIRP